MNTEEQNPFKEFRKKWGYLFKTGLMRQVDLAKLLHMSARQIQSIEAGGKLTDNKRSHLEMLGKNMIDKMKMWDDVSKERKK